MLNLVSRRLFNNLSFTSQGILPASHSRSGSALFSQVISSRFSTEKHGQQISSQNKKQEKLTSVDYYRNTIRNVNMKRNNRGRFNSFYLLNIIKMTRNEEQSRVMFEAYFNYLGHFTLIPNKVVDQLVLKALAIGGEVPLKSVLDIYENHPQLTYFPSYDTTSALLKFITKNKSISNDDRGEHLSRLIDILINSPLVKINRKIANALLQQSEHSDFEQGIKQNILKLLMFRVELIDEMPKEDLVSFVARRITANATLLFNEDEQRLRLYFKDLLRSWRVKESEISAQFSSNVAICAISIGLVEETVEFLQGHKAQLGTEFSGFFEYVKALAENSQGQNYAQQLMEGFKSTQVDVSIDNLKVLEEAVEQSQK